MGKKLNTEQFIILSNKIHQNKYDYSEVKYTTNKNKVKIICPEHGIFEQQANNHLRGFGCNRCNYQKKMNKEIFIQRANIIHNFKYDYSLVDYINARIKIKIICPEHGIFEQSPGTHVNLKHGCLKCQGQNKNNLEFINECKKIHNNKYDYSLVEYTRVSAKIKIICPDHGIFEQTANNHRRGRGCPVCSTSRGEILIKEYLDNNNIKYIWHHSFIDCRNKNPLFFDFYLTELNTCIEFDGIQHYEPVYYFNGIEGLKYTIKNDKIKNKYCEDNGINLIRFKYNEPINFNIIANKNN